MLAAYGAIFVLSFLVTVNLVPWILRLALRYGFVDSPGPRKIHARPIPYGGGLCVALGVAATILAGCGAAAYQLNGSGLAWFPEAWKEHLAGIVSQIPQVLTILTGGLAILVVGMADDRYRLSPWTRLAAESMIALVVTLQVGRLELFLSHGGWGEVAGTAVTVAWIVVMTNTFNLLDHFDGICGGVAIASGTCFMAVALLTGQLFVAALLTAMIGSTLGFFLFNFPPARMFLGDGGSLFLGYLMSVTTVQFTFFESGSGIATYFVPLCVMAVPIFDTARVCLLRWREGRSIFDADRNHLAHRLSARGLAPRTIVVLVMGLTGLAGLGSLALYWTTSVWGVVGVMTLVAAIFAMMTVLESR
jgi:UDP-GlcNAc:undecaprenyl-phosphate GlcNAc-1-phosphate transferase